MKKKIAFIERREKEFVSLEKTFRQIASSLSDRFDWDFAKVPFGNRVQDTVRNLLFFRRPAADVYHITGHIHYIAMLLPPSKSILSIMDIRFVHLPPGPRRYVMKKLYLDLPVRRMQYITAISDETKREIIKFTGCKEEKIRVLPMPLLGHIYFDAERPFNSDKPVILQIGTMENKNLPNLARALKGLRCSLRIIGRLTNEQAAVLKENSIEYENAYGLDDEQLRLEYENADIVAFCSTYEGFGLPIIEGQIMRKPVITSNASPMRETSGGAAYLADPQQPESIRAGIDKIISDDKFRSEIVAAGIKNAELYTPSSVVLGYEKLYDEILAANGR